jgi:Protein kinase domain
VLDAGTIVAGYRVDGVLGQGGMAVVYRATQLSLNRTVALKLLAGELSDDPSFRERFRREGQLQAALDHMHIVPVYEAGETEFGLFLAMRLITGSTLKELILTNALTPRRTLRILAQVAQALDSAHDAGLIHRDVKPQNILIGQGDQVYLADFGLIKSHDEAALTSPGQFMGTIDYVAPEQIQGEPASAASDCYALTAVMYECLSGRVPFPHDAEAAVLHDHIVTPPPRLSEVRPDLSPALDDVIAAGMAKNPALRPPASELIKAAARAVSSSADPSSADSEVAPPGQPTRISGIAGDGLAGDPTWQLTRGHGQTTAAAATAATTGGETRISREEDSGPALTAPASETREPVGARRAASGWLAGLVLIALAAAAVAGYLVGHPDRAQAVSFANSAAGGALQVSFPSGWHTGADTAVIPGLRLQSAVGLTDGDGASFLAGTVTSVNGAALLPAALQSRIRGGRSAADTVLLGSLRVRRYAGLAVRGAPGPVTLYVLPTSSGVATLACVIGRNPRASAATQCAQIAATLRLHGTRALSLAPSPAYARAVGGALQTLRTATQGPTHALSAAHTRKAQATASSGLSAAYAAATHTLGALAAPPQAAGSQRQIVSALGRLRDGYSAAAAAARSGSANAYRAATRDITRSSGALRRGLDGFRQAGYQIAS